MVSICDFLPDRETSEQIFTLRQVETTNKRIILYVEETKLYMMKDNFRKNKFQTIRYLRHGDIMQLEMIMKSAKRITSLEDHHQNS